VPETFEVEDPPVEIDISAFTRLSNTYVLKTFVKDIGSLVRSELTAKLIAATNLSGPDDIKFLMSISGIFLSP